MNLGACNGDVCRVSFVNKDMGSGNPALMRPSYRFFNELTVSFDMQNDNFLLRS